MRRLVLVGVVTVVLAAVAGLALAGGGSRAAGSGLIVYERGPYPPGGLFVVNPETRVTRRLTTGIDYAPAWSPDGRRIAFVRDTKPGASPSGQVSIYVMNADGSGVCPVTEASETIGSPDWSPDGKLIAFTRSDGNGNRPIYVVNADGSGLRRLTRVPIYAVELSWSPVGRLIAFSTAGFTPDIWTVRMDGTHPRRLTHDLQSLWPAMSPDGRQIAFVRSYDIWTMRADGTRQVKLTHTGNALERLPAWSPDGSHIVYEATEPWNESSTASLWMMDSDGTHRQRLARGALWSSPDWQPIPQAP